MISENPYRAIAAEYQRLLCDFVPKSLIPPQTPPIPPDAPNVLLFSPHPDDECLTGGLPLRLLRGLRYNILNFAVTLGSRPQRQRERFEELQGACNYLGFQIILPSERGLNGINPKARKEYPGRWNDAVEIAANLLNKYRPKIVFFPHPGDRHSTHVGTHYLAMDALGKMGADFSCFTIETEFWGAMENLNLMVESSCEEVGDLMAATAFHVGEVRRNPYHLRLPAWMADNVRRGGELVSGQGATVPTMSFATLYRMRKWTGGKVEDYLKQGVICSEKDDLGELFSFSRSHDL
ncbi:MAG: PIG-L family deacetylase [Cyanobacteriota bacterium]|nr:PIG-L family deacetylase [Cyanobacteriota bacterium]